MPFDCWKSFKSFGNVQMFKDIGVAHSVFCCLFVLCFTIPALSELSELTLTLKHKWVCANQFSICMLPLKYVHTLNWACAGFQLSMYMLPVEHVFTYTWSCTPTLEQVDPCILHTCDNVALYNVALNFDFLINDLIY